MNYDLIQYLIIAIIVFALLCVAWGSNVAKAQELLSTKNFSIVGVISILFLGGLLFPLAIFVMIIFGLFMLCCGNVVKKPKYIRKNPKRRR